MRMHYREVTRSQRPLSPQRTMLYALLKHESMYPGDENLQEMLEQAMKEAVSSFQIPYNILILF